jgi:hypothetical protein
MPVDQNDGKGDSRFKKCHISDKMDGGEVKEEVRNVQQSDTGKAE